MTTVKEQYMGGDGTAFDLKTGDDVIGQLLVNVRRDYQVRFSLSHLEAAVTAELFGRFLTTLLDEDAGRPEVAADLLERIGLDEEPSAAFGLTSFGEGALVDDQGNHAFYYVEQEHRVAGVDAALRRITGLRGQYFDRSWIEGRAAGLAQGVLDGLSIVRSYGAHLRLLWQAAENVGELARAAGEHQAALLQAREDVERRLEAARAARRPGRGPTLKGRMSALYNRILRAETSSAQGNTNAFLERELVTLSMRLLVLEYEKAVFDEMSVILEKEVRVDENSVGVLTSARRNSFDEARKAEWTRDYGVAGGELLLNGKALTDATIIQIWGESGMPGLANCWHAEYAARHSGEDVMSATGGELNAATLDELRDIIVEEVAARFDGMTVVDAAVALLTHGELDLEGRLEAAFKETASIRSLLAPYHDRVLDPQHYASVTYARSNVPAANAAFDRMLVRVKDTLPVAVETSQDSPDPECILFYSEYFCIPLQALGLYAESYGEFMQVKDEPRFCPHPEVYG